MTKQTRCNGFKTDSILTHSITICTKEEYQQWIKGKLIYDRENESLVDINKVNITDEYELHCMYETIDEYMTTEYLETYSTIYTTKSGDEIVIFGKYGTYD
jgi:hypothetical protein